MSRIDEVGGVVLQALEHGAGVRVAAERGGISERTVRSWLPSLVGPRSRS